MAGDTPMPKSLADQILDEMFAALGKREGFNSQTIERLRRLASKGDLKKSTQVVQAIKSAQEQHHEVA